MWNHSKPQLRCRNTPSFWLRELVERRRYPGLLAADHFEHFCPNHILYLGHGFLPKVTGWWFGNVWNMAFIFPYIGKNHPNWRTHIFQRGRYTINQMKTSPRIVLFFIKLFMEMMVIPWNKNNMDQDLWNTVDWNIILFGGWTPIINQRCCCEQKGPRVS